MHPAASDQLPSAGPLGVTRIEHRAILPSTMDLAHELAATGVAAGLLVIADSQERGRGRNGNHWASANGAGLWMTLLERPTDAEGVSVLSLRVGLALAQGLAPYVDGSVRLKWPNDVFVDTRKLAGILVEARWREAAIDWVAIGIGINMRVPIGVANASAVRAGVTRAELLLSLLPPLRAAAAAVGVLTNDELAAWQACDAARGRAIEAPISGRVLGVAADGSLRVQSVDGGSETLVRSGSLVFADGGSDGAV